MTVNVGWTRTLSRTWCAVSVPTVAPLLAQPFPALVGNTRLCLFPECADALALLGEVYEFEIRREGACDDEPPLWPRVCDGVRQRQSALPVPGR